MPSSSVSPCSGPAGRMPTPAKPRSHSDTALLHLLRRQILATLRPGCEATRQRSLHMAQGHWGPVTGARLHAALDEALSEMRLARVSPFRFSNPDCPRCAARVTPHEAQFLQILRLHRAAAAEKAQSVAFLLCEANPCLGFLAASERLAMATPSDNAG